MEASRNEGRPSGLMVRSKTAPCVRPESTHRRAGGTHVIFLIRFNVQRGATLMPGPLLRRIPKNPPIFLFEEADAAGANWRISRHLT